MSCRLGGVVYPPGFFVPGGFVSPSGFLASQSFLFGSLLLPQGTIHPYFMDTRRIYLPPQELVARLRSLVFETCLSWDPQTSTYLCYSRFPTPPLTRKASWHVQGKPFQTTLTALRTGNAQTRAVTLPTTWAQSLIGPRAMVACAWPESRGWGGGEATLGPMGPWALCLMKCYDHPFTHPHLTLLLLLITYPTSLFRHILLLLTFHLTQDTLGTKT